MLDGRQSSDAPTENENEEENTDDAENNNYDMITGDKQYVKGAKVFIRHPLNSFYKLMKQQNTRGKHIVEDDAFPKKCIPEKRWNCVSRAQYPNFVSV